MFLPLGSWKGPEVRLTGVSELVETSEGRMARVLLGFTSWAKALPWPT